MASQGWGICFITHTIRDYKTHFESAAHSQDSTQIPVLSRNQKSSIAEYARLKPCLRRMATTFPPSGLSYPSGEAADERSRSRERLRGTYQESSSLA